MCEEQLIAFKQARSQLDPAHSDGNDVWEVRPGLMLGTSVLCNSSSSSPGWRRRQPLCPEILC